MSDQCIRVATCNLNQWALDYDLNLDNVLRSIELAQRAGARFRTGPELELSGYGCEDHFLENDTVDHCWESLAVILKAKCAENILLDIGMPVIHRSVRYNCRVWIYNKVILGIRPKTDMANDGNYRETRWFTPWNREHDTTSSVPLGLSPSSFGPANFVGSSTYAAITSGRCAGLEVFQLPKIITDVTGQTHCPIGIFAVRARDVVLGSEVCEEMFTASSMNIELFLNGVDILANGSGSHHTLRKLEHRLQLMLSATRRAGGAYIYANQQGCDGGRLYYDGCACVVVDGSLIAQGSQFSVEDVEVISAVIDVGSIRAQRARNSSRNYQSAAIRPIAMIELPVYLCDAKCPPSPILRPRLHLVEEEIALGPACWLWDYLRRSKLGGFFLPLSGGADSAATAAIVASMCRVVAHGCIHGIGTVRSDVIRILGDALWPDRIAEAKARLQKTQQELAAKADTEHHEKKKALRIATKLDVESLINWETESPSPRALCSKVFFTCYMGTKNSSSTTRDRARRIAQELGSTHFEQDIDNIVQSCIDWYANMRGEANRPAFDGTTQENLALQNVQARVRMVQAYLAAQLLLQSEGRQGSLLVLGSSNVDEALRGFLTKYDCSSADINPIGGISKIDLRRFLLWAAAHLGAPALKEAAEAPATPELVPTDVEGKGPQNSETDMGLTFEQLGMFGRLRKIELCGPVSMFRTLMHLWGPLHPSVVSAPCLTDAFYGPGKSNPIPTTSSSPHCGSLTEIFLKIRPRTSSPQDTPAASRRDSSSASLGISLRSPFLAPASSAAPPIVELPEAQTSPGAQSATDTASATSATPTTMTTYSSTSLHVQPNIVTLQEVTASTATGGSISPFLPLELQLPHTGEVTTSTSVITTTVNPDDTGLSSATVTTVVTSEAWGGALTALPTPVAGPGGTAPIMITMAPVASGEGEELKVVKPDFKTPREIASLVKFFFRQYAINRHKMTTITPSYHAENYSPDDNRYDLRPFLYNAAWTRDFRKIDELVEQWEASCKQ